MKFPENLQDKEELLALQRQQKKRWRDSRQGGRRGREDGAHRHGEKTRPGRHRPDRYVAAWAEPDLLDGKVTEAFVVIFRSRGCAWWKKSGCFMCGYFGDTDAGVSVEDYRSQLEGALRSYGGQAVVKMFTSGSFLDPAEVPPGIQDEIVRGFSRGIPGGGGGADKIIVESRPEFVTNNSLQRLKAAALRTSFEIAIGLESATDEVLVGSINKGFRFPDFEKAAKIALENGWTIKAYILLKPPFLSEKEAIEDAVVSAAKAALAGAATISINPVNIQNFTVVERLSRDGKYRTPYIWSLIEVLKRLAALRDAGELPGETVLMTSPSGAGTRRGVHNCGECDKRLLEAVKRFSLGQDASALAVPYCRCREKWEDVLVLEDFVPFGL